MTPVDVEISRPLRLGEIITAVIRIFGSRPLAFIGMGVVFAAAYLGTTVVPVFVGRLAILAAAFTFSLAVAVRLVAGDRVTEALERVVRIAPSLLVLGIVVAVPFYAGSSWIGLLLPAIAWLGLTTFAIPAAVAEDAGGPAGGTRVTHALRRTIALARVRYLHAVGVVAALVVIDVLIGVLLAFALFSFADNGRYAALALAQVVLGPFFFIGLTVLYFEQGARARMLVRTGGASQ